MSFCLFGIQPCCKEDSDTGSAKILWSPAAKIIRVVVYGNHAASTMEKIYDSSYAVTKGWKVLSMSLLRCRSYSISFAFLRAETVKAISAHYVNFCCAFA